MDAECTFTPHVNKNGNDSTIITSDATQERIFKATAAKKAAKRLYIQAQIQ